jgi:hypothetical protein
VRCKTRANHGKQDEWERDAERPFGKGAWKDGSYSLHKQIVRTSDPWK